MNSNKDLAKSFKETWRDIEKIGSVIQKYQSGEHTVARLAELLKEAYAGPVGTDYEKAAKFFALCGTVDCDDIMWVSVDTGLPENDYGKPNRKMYPVKLQDGRNYIAYYGSKDGNYWVDINNYILSADHNTAVTHWYDDGIIVTPLVISEPQSKVKIFAKFEYDEGGQKTLNGNEIKFDLTDEQIKKALKCCKNGNCINGGCHFYKPSYEIDECTSSLAKATFDLINRQEVEIERLQTIIDDGAETCHNCHSKYAKQIEEAKSEAIKEFAERLKLKVDIDLCEAIECSDYLYDLPKLIDNLLKEMVGESK